MSSDGIVPKDSQSRQEGNMAKVFNGIILVFLICHMPRIILNVHEMMTIKNDGGGSAESNTRDLRRNPRPRWRDFIADLASFCPLPKATPGWARVPPFSNMNGNICYK